MWLYPCRRLATLMAGLGHRNLDVLKMDVEGASTPSSTTLSPPAFPPIKSWSSSTTTSPASASRRRFRRRGA